MSICELDMVFDTEQSSWVCTACGKFISERAVVTQDSVSWTMEMLCLDCAADISPRKRAGARTATNSASGEICPMCIRGKQYSVIHGVFGPNGEDVCLSKTCTSCKGLGRLLT
jgi:hypothetical protein